MQRNENTNIFCCFFAPWINRKSNYQRLQEELHQSHSFQNQNSDQSEQKPTTHDQLLQQTETQHAECQALAAVVASDTALGGTPCQEPNDVAAGIASCPSIASDLCIATDSTEVNVEAARVKSVADSVTSDSEVGSCAKIHVKSSEGSAPPNHREDQSKQSVLRSILKVKRCTNRSTNNGTVSNSSNKTDQKQASSPSAKRHLFPAYEPKNISSSKGEEERGERSVAFNPMARVLTIPSRKDIPLSQKVQVSYGGLPF